MGASRLFIANLVIVLVIAGSYWGRRIEGAELDRADFLQALKLDYKGWKTEEMQLTARETELLEPDAVLVRRYLSPQGHYAELAVIAGHRKKTVHTPGFCMTAGGWELVQKKPFDIDLGDQKIPAARAVFSQKSTRLMATYFFTDGEYHTRDLLRFQMLQMLRRLQVGVPLGALVRIIVPVGRDLAPSEQLSNDFAKALLPDVLKELRSVRVEVR